MLLKIIQLFSTIKQELIDELFQFLMYSFIYSKMIPAPARMLFKIYQ